MEKNQRFPRMGSEMISPHRQFQHEGHTSANLALQENFSVDQGLNLQGRNSDPELNKNQSYLTRLDKGGRGSLAVAQTGATSGANIHTDGISGRHTRKQSIQHFSNSGMGDLHTESGSGVGQVNMQASPELVRDPSMQINLHQNLYIDSKADLMAIPAAKQKRKDRAQATSHSEQNDSSLRLSQKRKSEFLPSISQGRRLMQLEAGDVVRATNPFKIESTTERVLAMGERLREVGKLEAQKFSLMQKIADNEDYIQNLSKKRLNLREDRSGIITDVKQITKINHLPPHINPKQTAARSPSPPPIHDSIQQKLNPLTTRNRSVARRNGGQSVTLVPIMESIGAAISPARPQRLDEDAMSDMKPAALTSRYKTPMARDTMSDSLMPSNSLKYLQTGKMEKETIKDYISTTRLMLRKGLTNEARKRDLSEVSQKYEKEVKKLSEAKGAFEEDYQRFITMKADMESMAQVGSEQLTSKVKNIQQLEEQIFLLQSEDDSLQQRIKEQAEEIQTHVNSKRIVSWLERELNLQLYDGNRRTEYLQSISQQSQDMQDDLSSATKHQLDQYSHINASQRNLAPSVGSSKFHKQVGQASFITQGADQVEVIARQGSFPPSAARIHRENSPTPLSSHKNDKSRRGSSNLATPVERRKPKSIMPPSANKSARLAKMIRVGSTASLGSQVTNLQSNADLESASELTAGQRATMDLQEKEMQRKQNELRDPDQMHLLQPYEFRLSELESRMSELDNFEIFISKRDVHQLMEKYEARNTRMLIDVNMGEDDIVQESSELSQEEKNKLKQKMNRVLETIQILKQRKVEAYRKLEYLSAPKRAQLKKKQEGKKKKVHGMELTFPRDHPDVPKMIETIVKLGSLLQEDATKTSSTKSAKNIVLGEHAVPAPSVSMSIMDQGSIASYGSIPQQVKRQGTKKPDITLPQEQSGIDKLHRSDTRSSPTPLKQAGIARPEQNASALEMASVAESMTEATSEEMTSGTAENQRVVPLGIDAQLVKMMQKIEVQARRQLEQYKDMLEAFKHDKKFQSKHSARLKELDNQRKEERQQAAREREEMLLEERRLRNIEKMKQKENVVANTFKRLTYRSPQPQLRLQQKKVEQTKDEQDFLKYLGAEFEMNEEQASESKKLASQGSMRSLSVPPSTQ